MSQLIGKMLFLKDIGLEMYMVGKYVYKYGFKKFLFFEKADRY